MRIPSPPASSLATFVASPQALSAGPLCALARLCFFPYLSPPPRLHLALLLSPIAAAAVRRRSLPSPFPGAAFSPFSGVSWHIPPTSSSSPLLRPAASGAFFFQLWYRFSGQAFYFFRSVNVPPVFEVEFTFRFSRQW